MLYFQIRRISSKTAVKGVLASALIFSVLFNLPRWFEIKAMDCLSETFYTQSSMVVPTTLFMNSSYTILYRNACFTIVMFFFPFITLTWVNCKIVSTLKTSNRYVYVLHNCSLKIISIKAKKETVFIFLKKSLNLCDKLELGLRSF